MLSLNKAMMWHDIYFDSSGVLDLFVNLQYRV